MLLNLGRIVITNTDYVIGVGRRFEAVCLSVCLFVSYITQNE